MGRPVIDETGNRYGRLLVLSRAKNNRDRNAMWTCRCACGNETAVYGQNLRNGNTKSCGCLADSLRLPEGGAAFTQLFLRIRRSAKTRGYTWELLREQVRTLTSQDCYYCGVPPSQSIRYNSSEYAHNGIDRVDNDLGYIESNCVPCCKWCNRSKSTRSVQEFTAWALRVASVANKVRG